MQEVFIIDALRTPIGALGGGLSSIRPDDLAALVLREIVKRNAVDAAEVDDVYLGCANQAGEDNRDIARMAALLAGFPERVPGITLNRLCASGLSSINMAARTIAAGEADLIIAGGVESMSRAPYSLPKDQAGFGVGNMTAWNTALGWRYPNPAMQDLYGTDPLGITAENIAEMTGITRTAQDRFALQSHQRAIAAQDEGRFDDEIISVQIPQRKGEDLLFEKDERPRRDTSLEKLSKLRAAFLKNGTVTAGNSSGMNDGASAVLLMSKSKKESLGLQGMVRYLGSSTEGIAPRIMGLGPVPATQKLLQRLGLSISDIQLAEINEAFAVQSLAVLQALDLSEEITNVNGGAIALGHPLGCSGARIFTTLIHEMKRRQAHSKKPFLGLASLCVGVGQGESTLVEWIGS
ncbi:MAG: thiolase family protein [Anaerolineaceae bacterium]|nr:thiolase family protein [Anaerolineaceae bacterium]